MEQGSEKKRVVVFGIFDGVHDGHRDLFRQAREYGDKLIVIVGRDAVAGNLKGRKPGHAETERVAMLKREPLVNDVLLGDKDISTYTVLVRCNPDVVCLGYDQEALAKDLKNWLEQKQRNISMYRLEPYHPEIYHNSLL